MFNKNKKSSVLILVSVAVIILIGYFAFAYFSKAAWPFLNSQNSNNSSENYSPPTDQEIKDSQDAKKNNSGQEQEEQLNTEQNTSLQTVSVAIAYAGFDETENAIDIRAFTPDVIEGDGICTAILTLSGDSVTKTSKAFIDSTTSQCEPILIPMTEFPTSGNWSLIVTYKSGKSTGSSSPMQVEVAL